MNAPSTISVAAPGSDDTLVFKRDGTTKKWVAEVPEFSRSFRRDNYRVYQGEDGWDCGRDDHPIVDKDFTDYRYKTRAYAMAACAEDYALVARMERWIEYMKTHEPPKDAR